MELILSRLTLLRRVFQLPEENVLPSTVLNLFKHAGVDLGSRFDALTTFSHGDEGGGRVVLNKSVLGVRLSQERVVEVSNL